MSRFPMLGQDLEISQDCVPSNPLLLNIHDHNPI